MYLGTCSCTQFGRSNPGVNWAHLHVPRTSRKACNVQGDLKLDRQEADANLGLPSRKWVSVEQIEEEGLSSSVKKVLKLVNEASSKQKNSIKRFFAPK